VICSAIFFRDPALQPYSLSVSTAKNWRIERVKNRVKDPLAAFGEPGLFRIIAREDPGRVATISRNARESPFRSECQCTSPAIQKLTLRP